MKVVDVGAAFVDKLHKRFRYELFERKFMSGQRDLIHWNEARMEAALERIHALLSQ